MTTLGYVTGTFRKSTMGEGGATLLPRIGRLSFYPTGTDRLSVLVGEASTPETVSLVDGVASVAMPIGSYHVLYQIEGLPYTASKITVESQHNEFNPLSLNTVLTPTEPVPEGKPNYIQLFIDGE